VTINEKWIYFDNPKWKKSWVDPGQPSASTSKKNINGHKILLCIRWDQEGVLYYELLRPNETVTADRYQQKLCRLSDELMQKRSFVANNRHKVILLHDNARSHVAKSMKPTFLNGKYSCIQYNLQIWHHRITISSDQCKTHLPCYVRHCTARCRRTPLSYYSSCTIPFIGNT